MEQLESLLTCPICLDRYRNPKLLPCQHSFCMEPCMEGLVDYVRRQVKCPECRAEHRIPYQGVQAFPTNVTLQRFLELHIELTGEIPDPTSNQVMERCQVCSEKSYCVVCAHCDKKVCPECKDAHMDVLKREISRISNQVRRVLHRLEDALSLTEKNSLHLQQNSLSVVEEIDDVYRRLAKTLKDRAEFLKHEVERYLQTELRNLSSFKHNMDQELSNIQSNCDLVDKYMQAESTLTTWDDCELMGTKDIFLKTMEFIRNFEYEPGDYARRVKFLVEKDPNTLAVSLGTYGDLYLPTTNLQACILGNNAAGGSAGGTSSSGLHSSKGAGADAASGLMRSKSDHRLTMQYRGQDYDDAGSSSGVGGRTSPVFGRKFGERKERAGGRKELATAYDPSLDPDLAMLEVPTKSRFRSRFARHLQDSFEDSDTGGRGDGPSGRKERERVLDTEDVTRGPLSGITKLIDSPRVIQRLQEMEAAGTKISVSKPGAGADNKSSPAAPVAAVQTPVAPWRATSRQVSEEDEIAKQKKMNKEGAAAVNARAAAATPNAPRRQQSNEPKSPPITTGATRTSTERSNLLDSAGAGTAAGAVEETVASRQRTSQPRKLSPERVLPKNTRSESSDSGRSETSSGSSRNTNTGAVFSAEEVKQRYLSKSSEKEQSSGRTTPQSRKDSTTVNLPTVDQQTSAGSNSGGGAAVVGGAAANVNGSSASSKKFQSRFLGKPSTTVEASKESSTSSSSESEEEEEEESESESSDEGTGATVKKATAKGAGSGSTGKPMPEKTSRMEKTDIGPLLAKSANARDGSRHAAENALGTYSSSSRSRGGSGDLGTSATSPSIAAYRRSRDAVSRVTSPPEREVVPSRYNSGASASSISTPNNTGGGSNYGSSRYSSSSGSGGTGAGVTGSGSDYGAGLTRSRTGSSLAYSSPLDSVGVDSGVGASGRSSGASDTSSRYNKYLNRSRHTFDDDVGGLVGSSSLSSPSSSAGRYGDEGQGSPEQHAGSPSSGAASARIAAVKDREKRREKLAKSKSSASIGHAVSFDDEAYVIGERRSSLTRRPSIGSASGVSIAAGQAAGRRKSTSTAGEIIPSSDDSASLSSWARYLKNKYGKGQSKSLDRRLSVDNGIASVTAGGLGSPGLGSPRSSISGPSTTAAGGNVYLSKKKLLFKFGSRGSDPGYFTWPRDVSVGPDGQIVVTDSSNHRIQVFNEQGAFISEFGSYGSGDGELDCPAGVCVNRIGQFIISDRYNHRIVVLDPSGRFLRAFGSQGTTDGRFNYPWGVTTDCLGFIFVCDKENNRICVFQSDGTFVGKILGLNHPHYIAVTSMNRVIVSDTNNHRIVVFDVNGHMITTFGSEGSDEGQFKFPRGIAVDETYGYVIVGDSGNNRIQIFTPDYKFLHSIGTWGCGDAEFKGMEGLAVTGSGKILVVDREQHCVKCF